MIEQEHPSLDELLTDSIKACNETGDVAPLAMFTQGLINYVEYLEAIINFDPDEPEEITLQ